MGAYWITFSGGVMIPAETFFPDEGHAHATQAECLAEVRRYIDERGVEAFLRDWCIADALVVEVGGVHA